LDAPIEQHNQADPEDGPSNPIDPQQGHGSEHGLRNFQAGRFADQSLITLSFRFFRERLTRQLIITFVYYRSQPKIAASVKRQQHI
jgi:hypothetical protein